MSDKSDTDPDPLSEEVKNLQAQVRGLKTQLGELRRQIDELTTDPQLLTAPFTAPPAAPAPPPQQGGPGQGGSHGTGSDQQEGNRQEEEQAPPPHIYWEKEDRDARLKAMQDLAHWVETYFFPIYVAGRGVKPVTPWCIRWWLHPEAVARLEALYCAWTEQVISPKAKLTGRATWITTYLDPIMEQLRSPTGPFIRCTTDPDRPQHTAPEHVPAENYPGP
ncbi:DUF4913 domain-containing protein [Actinomadura violacea]|uniref:DUF4913 domain-containing protein n=1 Tax=Actinomadura violacea TaxID=2819934 RepID=A0ABS3S856_9ACTN|nr:DUF4913 domain-containing protein [Actinomadura violacea]MBO2464943.1 DUF4913 domain-containing protein [Actinomadura violacea]